MPRIRRYCSKIFHWFRSEASPAVLYILDTLYFVFQPIIEELASFCLIVLAYIRSKRGFWFFASRAYKKLHARFSLFGQTSPRSFLDKHIEPFIFALAFFLELAFGLYLVSIYGSTFSGPDSISYLYHARNAIDNGILSGLSVLIGNWPPLFSMLQLPFVMLDILYTTGLSGTLVNAFMTGGTALFLFRLAGSRNARLALLAPFLFLSNIYVLLFGAIPMSEQTALFFLAAASYYFKNHWETGNIKEFIKCSFLLILGSLTRYEIWAVSVFLVSVFLFREMYSNRARYRLGYAHFPLWGIISWLLINYLIHRDLFWFNTQFLSNRMLTAMMPPYFKESTYLTLKHSFIQMDLLFGILLYLAIVSTILIIYFGRARQLVPIAIFFIPPLMQVTLMFQGQSFGFARYFYTSFPGIILPVIYLLDFADQKGVLASLRNSCIEKLSSPRFRISFFLISFFIGTSIVVMAFQPSDTTNPGEPKPWIFQSLDISNKRIFPEMRNEGRVFGSDIYFETPDKYKAYSIIKKLIGSEKVLMFSNRAIAGTFSTSQGVSPSQIIDDFDYLDYERVMREPWNCTRFVLVSPIDLSYARVINEWYHGNFYLYNYYFNDAWRSTFQSYYEELFEDGNLKLFRLRDKAKPVSNSEEEKNYSNSSISSSDASSLIPIIIQIDMDLQTKKEKYREHWAPKKRRYKS